jgi:hypothetical protein
VSGGWEAGAEGGCGWSGTWGVRSRTLGVEGAVKWDRRFYQSMLEETLTAHASGYGDGDGRVERERARRREEGERTDTADQAGREGWGWDAAGRWE